MHFSELTQKIEDLNAVIANEARTAIETELLKFFAEQPNLEAVRWEQYTPYFNDGDACVFRVHSWELKYHDKRKHTDADEDEDDGFSYSYSNPLNKWWENFARTGAAEPIFEAAFGDHVRVTADRENITVEEWDHD